MTKGTGGVSMSLACKRAGLGYVHRGDQAVTESVRMVDGSVENEVASEVMHDLVYGNYPIACVVRID
jgi:hypothetical protein